MNIIEIMVARSGELIVIEPEDLICGDVFISGDTFWAEITRGKSYAAIMTSNNDLLLIDKSNKIIRQKKMAQGWYWIHMHRAMDKEEEAADDVVSIVGDRVYIAGDTIDNKEQPWPPLTLKET